MSLDKYRRTIQAPTMSTGLPNDLPSPTADQLPGLGSNPETLLSKANRYRQFVDTGLDVAFLPPTHMPIVPNQLSDEVQPTAERQSPPEAKGNRFKSKKEGTSRRKLTVQLPSLNSRKEPTPLTGVKIVYLDETMREEYIQIAGYLMIKHRVKLTMTAYFCFLHDQAVSQQSDESFMNSLAQFVRPTVSPTLQ